MIQVSQFKNLLEVIDYFKDQDTCKEYIEQQRWGGKVCCPHCGHDKVGRTKRGFKCHNKRCYKKFSVLVGTPMENTKIKLRYWFAAIYLLSAHKKGISSHQMARDLRISQKCAWFLNMRIRQMFIDQNPQKFGMVIQADETFCGGKNKNRHRDKKIKGSQGRSFKDKTPVLGLLEPGGKVKMFVIPTTEPDVIQPILEQNIEHGAILMTDEWAGYMYASKDFCHVTIDHSRGQYVDGMVTVNGIENVWSILKRGVIGIYHHVTPKHLNRYCREFVYRYNTRKIDNETRFDDVFKNVNGNRLTYKMLKAA